MELVYLWVEKYKNIEKQGFNFSPKFRCEYNPDTEELKIEENPNYVSIFPDNINITAIVGKNGSGKSNLLKIILKEFVRENLEEKIVLIVYNDKKINVFSNIDNINIYFEKNKIEKENLSELKKKMYPIFIDFSLANAPFLLEKDSYKENYAIEPSRFNISSNLAGKIEPTSFDFNLCSNVMFFYWYIYKEKLEIILKDLNLPKFIKVRFDKKSPHGFYIKEEALKKLYFDKAILKKFNLNFDEDVSEKIINNSEKLTEITDKIKKELQGKDFNIYDNSDSKEELKHIGYLFQLMTPNFLTDDGLLFNQLSTGQKIILSYFGIMIKYYLYSFNKEKQQKKALILIDEVETSFHPEWQRKFLYYLVTFIQKIKLNDFYDQFIIATHSPFIISDLPKENIIFLDKDENGKCKVVDGLNEKKETFGANIHTLLSDSFFMEDGLMGEFAKSKINEIIDFHNKIEEKYIENESLENEIKFYEENKDNFWNIQRITGEEYLKQIIKNHLIEIEKLLFGKDRAKEEEIKRLQKEIERLKNND